RPGDPQSRQSRLLHNAFARACRKISAPRPHSNQLPFQPTSSARHCLRLRNGNRAHKHESPSPTRLPQEENTDVYLATLRPAEILANFTVTRAGTRIIAR